MNCAIVENNIIVNVIVIPEGDSPAAWGGKELPPGKWIGDQYNSEATLAARLDAAEASAAELSEALELILSGATEDTEVATDEA